MWHPLPSRGVVRLGHSGAQRDLRASAHCPLRTAQATTSQPLAGAGGQRPAGSGHSVAASEMSVGSDMARTRPKRSLLHFASADQVRQTFALEVALEALKIP